MLPMTIPIIAAIPAATSPTERERRAPYRIRAQGMTVAPRAEERLGAEVERVGGRQEGGEDGRDQDDEQEDQPDRTVSAGQEQAPSGRQPGAAVPGQGRRSGVESGIDDNWHWSLHQRNRIRGSSMA
jgi:hypothetical protein